ncbi:MAG: nucleotide exchange factor GrpE [Verrucomicrobiales bacterium]|nr:nucleotide exchange factor GrpE [Verrucomicrobiales bacterium]|tara:strand:+ start:18960 stop:19574 length:615 start_codon:yes stop_codon:yes gene_type:complete
MKFWKKMGKKKKAAKAYKDAELTTLEKLLAEKAAAEEAAGEEPSGPKTLKEAAEKIAELESRVLRATADLDNYRKRAQREKEEARQFANQSLLEKLLPVLDNFEMAMDAAKDADPAVRDGVEMILGQLKGVLNESGVEEVDALGQEFDPALHEAVSQEETTEAAEGTVVKQLRKGYRLHERLVRPASVIVAKAPAEAPAEEAGS